MHEQQTVDGKRLFPGARLFDLRATHGVPLDVSLDQIMNEQGMAVDWPAFTERARAQGWWDFQTLALIEQGLADATVPPLMRDGILTRFKAYVLAHPHPGMQEVATC